MNRSAPTSRLCIQPRPNEPPPRLAKAGRRVFTTKPAHRGAKQRIMSMSELTKSYGEHLRKAVRDARRKIESQHKASGQGGAVVFWTAKSTGAKS